MNAPTTRETADHAELAEIISDDEIARVHGHANFGPSITPREVVNEGVRKYAVGYHSGYTQLTILLEHGLITNPRPGRYDANLTKKGKKYARVLYRREAALLSEIAALRGALTWVDQVQPSNLPWSGAQVEMTWDEFNAMRAALGLKERKPGKPNGHSYNWKKRATQAERQRDELLKALEPFAKAADKLDGLWSEDDWRWNDSVRSGVTVRDIRRASKALANQGADQ